MFLAHLIFLLACSPHHIGGAAHDSAVQRVAEDKRVLEASMTSVIWLLRENPAVDPAVVAQAELELALFHRRFAPWTFAAAGNGLDKLAEGECIGPGNCGGFGIAMLPNMDVGYSSKSHVLIVSPRLAITDPTLPFLVFGALSSALTDIDAGDPSPDDTPVMPPEQFEKALMDGVKPFLVGKTVWL